MPDIRVAARDEIVDRDHAMTFRQKPVGQMRPQKAGPTGDDGNGISFVRRHCIYLAGGARICQQEVREMTKAENGEARMTNDEGSPNAQMTKGENPEEGKTNAELLLSGLK